MKQDKLIAAGLIPLDKSWAIRMGVLDLMHHRDTVVQQLSIQSVVSADLQALHKASKQWEGNTEIEVGESATLLRFLQFLSWKKGYHKTFVRSGTLGQRSVTSNPTIVEFSQQQLLQLDNGTSQWASAAVLCGDNTRLDNPPYKLNLTYEAVDHYSKTGNGIALRYDQTIARQAQAFAKGYKKGVVVFNAHHSEDYAFARAFDLISLQDGARKWPSLRGHESNRIREMEEMLDRFSMGNEITSNDHRVVQAIAMVAEIHAKPVAIVNPNCVGKSWPQFWDFMEHIKR